MHRKGANTRNINLMMTFPAGGSQAVYRPWVPAANKRQLLSLSSDEPESLDINDTPSPDALSASTAGTSSSYQQRLALQIVPIIREVSLVTIINNKIELQGMRPLDDTRPGDDIIVALDFYGDRLVMDDVSFSSVRIRGMHATISHISVVYHHA